MREPRKAAWLRLETDPEFHFDYFLGEKLGKTIAEIQAMPLDEWMTWGVYFGRQSQARELASKKTR